MAGRSLLRKGLVQMNRPPIFPGFQRFKDGKEPEYCDVCADPISGGVSLIYTSGDDDGGEIALCYRCIGWGTSKANNATAPND